MSALTCYAALPRLACLASLVIAFPASLSAQTADTVRTRPPSHRVIRLTDALFAVGGLAVISLADERVQRTTQAHRSPTLESLAAVFRGQGTPIYYGSISLGVLTAGLVTGHPGIERAGGRLVASVLASGAVMQGTKMLIGRSRPNANVGAFDFHPFSTLKDADGVAQRESMPSGHTVAAFAVATSIVDDVRSTSVAIVMYTWATGAAFSRVYENRHWMSDTVAGALLGITTAKLINGRWRVFGLTPPRFLISGSGAMAVGWSLPL